MRIRQIKPSWFLDKELRRGVTADAREFYIGLWMVADDAGWIVWDVERIAAELYPYGSEKRREQNVAKWADALERLDPDEPHLVVWTCGHARVPKMPGHQRIAGKQAFTVARVHVGEPGSTPPRSCREAVSRIRLSIATPGEPLMATDDSPGRVGKEVGNGTVGNGSSAGARDGAPTEFQRRVDRQAALGQKVTV